MKANRIVGYIGGLCLIAVVVIASKQILNDKQSIQTNAVTLPTAFSTSSLETYDSSLSVSETKDSITSKTETTALELHSTNIAVFSMEDVDLLIDSGIEEYKRTGPQIIDVNEYYNLLQHVEYSERLDELKSYIYHMMLNSIDYFQTASGRMTYAMNPDYPIDIYFQTDMPKQISYEIDYQFGEPVSEFYVADSKIQTVNCKNKTYRESLNVEKAQFIISDNERYVQLDNGEFMTLNRSDNTNLGIPGNSCLFPQSVAILYLNQFDHWTISGVTDYIGRNCAKVEGVNQDCSFEMLIDTQTGAMLSLNNYNSEGKVTGNILVHDISFNEATNCKRFDGAEYSLE